MDIDSIGIGVETREVKQASKDLDKLGLSADKASGKTDRFSKSTKDVESAASKASRVIGKLAVAYAALSSLRALGGVIDSYTKLNAQLKIASRSQEDFASSMDDVKRISALAQSSLEGTATLYSRLANTLKDTNVTQQQFANITESVALGLKVSGASAGEAQSAMLQLSQAFASGVLRGEEFNAVSEASFPLMKALADSMEIPIEQLRSMAMEGLITRDELVKAFSDEKLINTFREQAKEVNTMGGAVQNAKNEFLLLVGAMAKKTGIVDIFTVSINAGSQALRSFNSLLTTGKFKLDSFLPAYDKYRQKMDAEAKKSGLTPKFGFAGKIGDAITADEVAGIPSFGGILTASDPKEKAEEIIKASGNASKAISNDIKKLAQEQQEIEENRYRIEVEMATDQREWATEQQKEAEERVKKNFDIAEKQSDERINLANREAKEIADKFERRADDINRSLTDALMRGFESGKSVAENFIDTLKNMFKTLVLEPIVNFLVDSSGITKVLGALGGTFASGSANAAASGSGSIMSSLGGIKDVISSLNSSLDGAIQSLAGFLSNGKGGLGDAIGGFLWHNSSQIADVLPYAGAALALISGDIKGAAFQGAGVAIGSAIGGPIGGAIGGALGGVVGSLFGGKGYDRFGTSVTGRIDNNGYRKTGQGVIYDKDIGAGSALNNINSQFSSVLSAFLRSNGDNQSVNTYSGLYQRGASGKSGGIFSSHLTGRMEVVLKNADLTDVYNALVSKVFGEGLAKAIRNSNISGGIKKFFNGLTDKQDVADAILAITSVKNAIKDLPPVFKALQTELDTTAFKSSAAQLTARFQAVGDYVNLFYTDAEKFETITKQLNTQFSALNQTLPDSRDEFRALVDGINVVDEATANTFYGLVSLAPALNDYYNALQQQQADGIEQVNKALADGLDRNLFSTYADYVSGQANIMAGSDAIGYMAKINNPVAINAVMADEIKQLRAENSETKLILSQIAFNTKQTAKVQKQWNGDGLPEERVY